MSILWVPVTPEQSLEKEKEATRREALLTSFAFKVFQEGFKKGYHEGTHGHILLPEEFRIQNHFFEFMEKKAKL